MQNLQEKASEWSGVKQSEAFAIDGTNLFEKLGIHTFVNLSTNFYNRVYDDEQQWFRSIFGNSKKEDAIQNQYEFFVQRMGGPPLYSQRRGHPALIGRHRPFPVTHEAANRWLHHMQLALDSTPDIDADSKLKMMNFFRHTAFFLVAGDELKNQNFRVQCKHANQKTDAPHGEPNPYGLKRKLFKDGCHGSGNCDCINSGHGKWMGKSRRERPGDVIRLRPNMPTVKVLVVRTLAVRSMECRS